MIDPPKNKTASRWDTATQVFTYGEDSYALPLTSELDALCGENVNWILLRRRLAERSSNRMKPTEQKNAPLMRSATQVFAFGEDTHVLRLTSELVDLRAGYVNWRACAHQVQIG